MNREIKFRAWIKQSWDSGSQKWAKNKILYNAYPYLYTKVCLPDSGIGFANEGEFELMQYTGLKDKNGKEIYEGDIISHNSKIFVICYSKNLGIVGIMLDKNYHTFTDTVKRNHAFVYFHYIANVSKYLEVIGNIYENPELL